MFIDSALGVALKDAKIVFLGADALLKNGIINKIGSGIIARIAKDEKILVCSHLGTKKSVIKYGPANEIKINEIPSVIIVLGKLNFKEEEALELWK